MVSSIKSVLLLSSLSSLAICAEPHLVHIADIHLDVAQPYLSGETPFGAYAYVPLNGGTFNTTSYQPSGYNATAPLHARLLPGSNDHPRLREDGAFELDLVSMFEGVNVPNNFWVRGTGYVEPADLNADHDYRFGELNAYQLLTINTDSKEYGWLTSSALVGRQRNVIKGLRREVELKIYRVVMKHGESEEGSQANR